MPLQWNSRSGRLRPSMPISGVGSYTSNHPRISYRPRSTQTATMDEIILKTVLPAPLVRAWTTWSSSSQLCTPDTYRQEQLKVLLSRCRDMIQQLAEHYQYEADMAGSMATRVREVEGICKLIMEILNTVTDKGLLWCVTNATTLENRVAECEKRIDASSATIYHMILRKNVDKMVEARKRDQQGLTQILSASSTAHQLVQVLRDHGSKEKTPTEVIDILRNYVAKCPVEGSVVPEHVFIHNVLKILCPSPGQNDYVHSVRSADVELDLTKPIGHGSSGEVYVGQWLGAAIAIKRMYPQDARAISGVQKNLQAFDKEVRIWSTLHHPNILDIYGVCMEAEVFGTISDYLQEHKDADKARLVHEVSAGLAFLHSKEIVHGDIKCTNILIGDDCRALLADFGLSIKLFQFGMQSTYTEHMCKQQPGTPIFMAPEVLLGQVPDKAADVYSLGLTIWEIFRGDPPNSHFLSRELLKCWAADPKVRPMAEEARQALDPKQYQGYSDPLAVETGGSDITLQDKAIRNVDEHGARRMSADAVDLTEESRLRNSSNTSSAGTLVESPLSLTSFSDGIPSSIVSTVGPAEDDATHGDDTFECPAPSARPAYVSRPQYSPSVSKDGFSDTFEEEFTPLLYRQSLSPSPAQLGNLAGDLPQFADGSTQRVSVPVPSQSVPPQNVSSACPVINAPTPRPSKQDASPLPTHLNSTSSSSSSPSPSSHNPFLRNQSSSSELANVTKVLANVGWDSSKQGLPWDLDKFLKVMDFRGSFAKEIGDFDTFLADVVSGGISVHYDAQKSLGSAKVRHLVRLALCQHVVFCDDSMSTVDGDQIQTVAVFTSRLVRRAMWLTPDKSPGAEVRFVSDRSARLSGLDRSQESSSRIDREFQKMRPSGCSNLGTGLRTEVLQPFVYDVLKKGGRGLQRPVLITVVINSAPFPENRNTVKDAIMKCKQRLIEAGYKAPHVLFNVYNVDNLSNAKDFMEDLNRDAELQDVLTCVSDDLSRVLTWSTFRGSIPDERSRLRHVVIYRLALVLQLRRRYHLPAPRRRVQAPRRFRLAKTLPLKELDQVFSVPSYEHGGYQMKTVTWTLMRGAVHPRVQQLLCQDIEDSDPERSMPLNQMGYIG
ncbi:hypothetical protein NM688_g2520 [Phlebia brevispora]|uniref:Uncharacterized protein n=1 Tax=Phlebia brevispora TaxID=194682 RepID=A0ACC1T8A2_9APHY|nr:hypothetical protein NM688_g2520 [Phlebia brevispora]